MVEHREAACPNFSPFLSLIDIALLQKLLALSEEDITLVANEILVSLCCHLKSDDLVYLLIQEIIVKVENGCSYQKGLPYLSLIDQLLRTIPVLAQNLTEHADTLLEYVVSGLSYPSEEVRVCVTSILGALIGPLIERGTCLKLEEKVAMAILPIIASSKTQGLQTSATGLLGRVLNSSRLTDIIMQADSQPSFSATMKKMLVSRIEILQTGCVQCISQVIVYDNGPGPRSYTEQFLDEDIAEFLFEALSTTDSLLLSAIFSCLLLLAKHDSFFTKCHSVYGIDAIVRALQHCQATSTGTLSDGLQLLSKILERQPQDLKLLTSANINRHICDILADCIKQPDSNVTTQATLAFKYLLRRDHQPSPVDFQQLIKPMDRVLTILQSLPRPLVKPSQPGGEKPRGRGDGRVKDEATSKRQDCLERCLDAVLSGLRLCQVCQEDPTADPEAFSSPKLPTAASQPKYPLPAPSSPGCSQRVGPTRENSLAAFITYLLDSVDKICIPVVMVNHDCLTNQGVYTSLFDSLGVSLGLPQEKERVVLAEKLVESSFIQLALEIRHVFTAEEGCDQVKKAADIFLAELISVMSSDKVMLESILPQISGSPAELCRLLDHSSVSERGEGALSHLRLQEGLLTLLYHAWLKGDQWVGPAELCQSLMAFITQHSDISSLKPDMTKQLLFLFADSFVKSGCQGGERASSMLADHLSKMEIASVFTNHQSVVEWIFTSTSIPEQIVEGIFTEWILELPEEDDISPEDFSEPTDLSFTLHLMSSKPTCIRAMLNLLETNSPNIRTKCAFLLRELVMTGDPSSLTHAVNEMKTKLPNLVQNLLMAENQDDIGEELQCILGVLCALYQHQPASSLKEADLKLIYHVIGLLTKETERDCGVILAGINLLTTLLVRTAGLGETRVLSLVTSNKTALGLLGKLSSEDISKKPVRFSPLDGAAIILLAYLTLFQKQLNVKVNNIVHLEEEDLVALAHYTSKPIHRICIMQLWTAIFLSLSAPGQQLSKSPTAIPASSTLSSSSSPANSAGSNPSLLNLHISRTRQNFEEDPSLPVSFTAQRQVFAILQNTIMQGSELLRENAITCMKAMVGAAVEKSPENALHLIGQPWNELLISSAVDIYRGTSTNAHGILELITMFLQQGNSHGYVTEKQVTTVLDTLMEVDPALHDTQSSFALLHFLKAVLARPELPLTSKHRTQLVPWLDQIKMHVHQFPTDPTNTHLVILNDVMIAPQLPATVSLQRGTRDEILSLLQDVVKQVKQDEHGPS
ncbi:meiosis inhibitor protein 1-like [Diadema setosum]|uniref:meiosis inhibitor protein 1-like n=1 Tax=Diadema setosum TaxID=31175 RepID=UPI003B3ACFE4